MKHTAIALILCFLIISCSSNSTNNNSEAPIKPVTSHISENPQDPFEVYNSMARAIKYNIGSLLSENNKKIITAKELKNPHDKINVFIAPGAKNDIFDAYKRLSVAILLAKDSSYAYYQDASQNLMLAGISAYNKAGFAKAKQLDIKRRLKNQERELDKINQRISKSQNISTTDDNRKEALEIYIIKAQTLLDKYAQNIQHFDNLESLNADHVKFGSRKYFEAKNFKPDFSLENFENLAYEQGIIENLEQTKHILAKNHPNAYRIEMNTEVYKNQTYQQEVVNEANNIAIKLLNKEISINEAKLLKIKLAYYIARLLELDYHEANQNYANAYKNYNQSKKDRANKNKELEAHAQLLEAQYHKNNAQGAYAISTQNLYFITSPFNIDSSQLQRAVGFVAKDIKKYATLNAANLMSAQNYKKYKKQTMPAVNPIPQWADPNKNWLKPTVEEYKK